MKKLILFFTFTLPLSGCVVPHYQTKPDTTFTYNTELKVRLDCDAGSTNQRPGTVQVLAFVESNSEKPRDLIPSNFVLKSDTGKEYKVQRWRFNAMDNLRLNLRTFNLQPEEPVGDFAKASVSSNQANLMLIEFTRPAESDFYFQIRDGGSVLFSAFCAKPTQLEDTDLIKSLKAVPNKK